MSTAIETRAEKKDKRPSTAHLKIVPETRELRDRVRVEVLRFAGPLDRSKPLTRQSLQQMAENLLKEMGLGEQYLGFTMVAITNEFWREQVQAVDFDAASCFCHIASNMRKAVPPITISSGSTARSAGPAQWPISR